MEVFPFQKLILPQINLTEPLNQISKKDPLMTGMLFTLTMEKIIHTLDIPKVLLRMAIIAPHIYAERFALFMASLKM